jgi:uncharacterized membrane protein
MAETGDRETPNGPLPGAGDESDLDAAVGFASPEALIGRPRAPEPAPPPAVEPAPEPVAIVPEPAPPAVTAAPAAPAAPPEAATAPAPAPAGFGARQKTPPAEAPMGLHAVYALILFAVPTLGASAVVGLAAVVFRDPPDQEPWASHHVYQLRTLWTAAIVAVLGAILIVVNLGVFVLFGLVIWLLMRGAWGVWLLTRGRAVPRPRGWGVG